MHRAILCAVALGLAALPAEAWAQKKRRTRDEQFVHAPPAAGDALPQLTVYTPDGKPFDTADLRGRYTVLVFGCLT